MRQNGFWDLTVRVIKQHGALILLLSGAYLIDLYLFQSVSVVRKGIQAALGFNSSSPEEIKKSIDFAIWTTFWDYVLMVIGGLLWGALVIRSRKMAPKLILTCVILGLLSSLLLGLLFLPEAAKFLPDANSRINLFRAFRVLSSLSISGGIGLSTVFICLATPRRYWTIAITVLCTFAMIGPVLVSLVAGQLGKNIAPIFFIGAFLGLIWVSAFAWMQVKINAYVRQISEEPFDEKRYEFDSLKRNFHFYLPALLIGAIISFFLSTLISHADVFYNGIKDTERSRWMYIGIGLGCLVSGLLSWQFKKRKRVVIAFLALQGIALGGYLYFSSVGSGLVTYRFVSGFLGFSVGIWGIMLLQVFETLDTRYRFFMCVLAPNVWRGGGGILLLVSRNTLNTAQSDKIGLVLILGAAVILIALVAGVFMKDNFENSYEFSEYGGGAYREGFSKPINDYATQKELLSLSAKEIGDIELTIERGKLIHKRLLKAFQDKLYLSYLYFIPGGTHSANQGKQGKIQVNIPAYMGLSKTTANLSESFIHQLETYLKQGKCASLTNLSVEGELEVIMLYNSQEVTQKSIEGFARFNLANIKLSPADAELVLKEMGLEGSETPVLEGLASDGDLFSKTNLAAFAQALEVKEAPVILSLKKLLILRKADAMRYPKGQYWVYVVRPVATTENKVADTALLMQSASEIPLLKLQEITNLLRVVVLEHTNFHYQRVERDAIYRSINLEQNHTLRGEIRSLKERVKSLIAKLKKGNYEEAEHLSRNIQGKVNWMSVLNIVSLTIMKNEWKESQDDSDDETQFTRREVSVKEKLCEALETLLLSLDSLKISENHEKAIIEKCIPALKLSIEQIPGDLKVAVVSEMLYIVFINLLANALAYSEEENPDVAVKWIDDHNAGGSALHFYNNRWMPPSAVAFIKKGGGETSGYSVRRRAGLRTIFQIFKNHQFNENNLNGYTWKLDVAASPANAILTDIFIEIPKQDVIYEHE